MAKYHLHAFRLPLGQRNAQLSFNLLHHSGEVYGRGNFQCHLDNLAGGLAFLGKYVGQVDVSLIGYHYIGQNHGFQFLFYLRLLQPIFLHRNFLVEKLHCGANHLCRFHVEMAALAAGLLQRIEQGALYPHGVLGITARLLHDSIHTLESESRNLAQAVRTFSQKLNSHTSKVLVDLHGRGRRHLERSQQSHQLPHDLALSIAGLDLFQSFLRNAADLQQTLRMLFQHIQSVYAKARYDSVRRLFPDALQKAGGKIAADALDGRRDNLMPTLHLELTAVFPLDPRSFQFHLHRICLGQVIAHGGKANQIIVIVVGASGLLGDHDVSRLQPQNGVPAGGIAKQRFIKRRYDTHSVFLLAFTQPLAWAA